MKTYPCNCGGRLFFENTLCTVCGCEVGWCEACRRIVPLFFGGDGTLRCGRSDCGVTLVKCFNYSHYQCCNRCISRGYSQPEGAGGYAPPIESSSIFAPPELCRSCRLTHVIPDLALPENLTPWMQLEAAKRRLLFQLDELGLAYDEQGGAFPCLSFEFMANTESAIVHTGHADGVITINLDEADPVKRETVRQQFGEPHRTLIGHLRHEVAHYFWLTLVSGKHDFAFAEVFGDPLQPSYGSALEAYHQTGPPPGWVGRFISAYAAAHPWEDFAETFAYYLDMRSVLATAEHHMPGFIRNVNPGQLDDLLNNYHRLGVILNELNRVMGLTDLLPEVIAEPIRPKLQFCHDLVTNRPV